MINYLLKLLETSRGRVENSASVIAQIVKTLKNMLNSVQYLTEVRILTIFYIRLN